jgi:hypothetical protein
MNLSEIKELLAARITFYLEPYIQQLQQYSIESSGNRVKVIGAIDDTSSGQYALTRVFISQETRKMFICNTRLPDSMRHKGIGKKLIKIVHKVATELRYELFIAPMSQAFHEALRKRGAVPCEKSRLLKIVDSTMLD